MLFRSVGSFVLLQYATNALRAQNSTPQALNPQLTNTIGDKGGPTLYYNGSGPVPPYNETSPIPAPFTPLNATNQTEDYFYNQIAAIVANGSNYTTKCGKCLASTDVIHKAAVSQSVSVITDLLIRICNLTKFSIYATTCEAEFSGVGGIGPYWAQLFAKMNIATGDYQAWCYYQWDTCTVPPTIEIDESKYFSPKPPQASVVPKPSGKTINVLHLSDWHLDPRYDIGSEANCSQYLCCRPYSTNTVLDTGVSNASVPASRFGYLYCDSPPDLALSSFKSMPQFFNVDDISFTIFTGDIVSHDNDDQLSRAYVEYEENVTYAVFKAEMGNKPIYPTLGNHDSLPEAYNTPNDINGGDGTNNIFSWNYDLLSSMWEEDGWISGAEASFASTHYGAYAHTTAQGLRIISINTDFWYVDNVFNYFNFTNPDQSGILSFLISELETCEKQGQRAWIIGHVLSGYDGSNGLPNPTALFYSIVRRFAPATIAAIFFGHTHEDQIQIFYDYSATSLNGTLRNTNDIDISKPLTMGFIGPSITPLTGNNAGYQLYQVDAKTFEIMEIKTYFANVSESLTWTSPVWQFEYDARSTYDVNGTWPGTSPLNATFWTDVTYSMLSNQSLVETYNFLETKSSVVTKNCSTAACAEQKVCYIRSGSGGQGYACPYKQGPF
ncbi:hypothetical protein MMC28_009140 [Mycoblastus sanguinarius]|nr:hypothetical protein [Mycoblastus sanguinarius]